MEVESRMDNRRRQPLWIATNDGKEMGETIYIRL